MKWYYVCWPWLTSKRVAQVCQYQLSFLFANLENNERRLFSRSLHSLHRSMLQLMDAMSLTVCLSVCLSLSISLSLCVCIRQTDRSGWLKVSRSITNGTRKVFECKFSPDFGLSVEFLQDKCRQILIEFFWMIAFRTKNIHRLMSWRDLDLNRDSGYGLIWIDPGDRITWSRY